jgi:hypothetical protein
LGVNEFAPPVVTIAIVVDAEDDGAPVDGVGVVGLSYPPPPHPHAPIARTMRARRPPLLVNMWSPLERSVRKKRTTVGRCSCGHEPGHRGRTGLRDG